MDKQTIRERIIIAHQRMLVAFYALAVVFFVLHIVFLLLGDEPGDGGRKVDVTPTPDKPWSVPKEWISEYAAQT